MTTLDSLCSAAESTGIMDDPRHKRTTASRKQPGRDDVGAMGDEDNPEVWDVLNKSFREVQSVLDRNRVLIQQVNENHQSKIPDNMVKNVDLIREINGNISKVRSLYSDLSSDFSTAYRRHAPKDGN